MFDWVEYVFFVFDVNQKGFYNQLSNIMDFELIKKKINRIPKVFLENYVNN